MKGVLFSALIGTLVACAASAQPITCPPPPSTSDVKSSLDVGTEVSLLSRFLSKLGLNYKEQTAITQNLSQLPNADELYKQLYLMSMKCQSIMAKREPDEEKIREWNDFIDQMANYHPPNPNLPSPYPSPPYPSPMPSPPPPQPSLSKAEAGALALQWIQSIFDLRTDISRALSLSSLPFCTSSILRSAGDFRSAFSDRSNFGQASDLYISSVDNVGPYLYATQQRLSNMQRYEMRTGRVTVLTNEINIARNCIAQNVISNDDYVVEVHVWLPSVGKELFAHVVVSARNRSIKGFLG
jgi:hypothetical protein